MFNYVFLIVLYFMFVLYCLRLGIEFSRLMAHYKCILSAFEISCVASLNAMHFWIFAIQFYMRVA